MDRLGKLSGEKSRKFIENLEEIKEVPEIVKAEGESDSPDREGESSDNKPEKSHEKKKRKGVGYTTGVGQTWNVNKYMEEKKIKDSQI